MRYSFVYQVDRPCRYLFRSAEVKQVFSPVYVPFTEHEVRRALRLSRSAYARAVQAGALVRSVHFDCRVSPTTALHSLVDVVRFDLTSRNTSERPKAPEIVEQYDWWLDAICSLDEDCEELRQIALFGGAQKLMMLVLREGTAPVSYKVSAAWDDERTVFMRVIDSWCRCYRALHEMLVADEIRFNS